MMPMVPSYLRWLEEVLFLNTHPGLVELLVLRSAYGFECCSDSQLWKPKKAADVRCAEEFAAPGNQRLYSQKTTVTPVYHDVRLRSEEIWLFMHQREKVDVLFTGDQQWLKR